MKKLLLCLGLLVAFTTKAQTPQLLSYQGIARDASGNIITTAIGIQFEILQGSASGTLVYSETNNITPSSAGIFTAAIGAGSPGTFSAINWANSPYFIRVSIDPSGGTSYSTVGTSQLLSVPYALYAEGTKPSTLSISGNSLSINNGNTVTLPAGTSYTAGNGISISGNTITNIAPTPTLIPSGISSITGTHPTFTIDVPPPALNYNTGTNVLTLTQGTAVATTTLVGAGSNTVAMFAQGIASVTPVGAGSNFTVSVQSPSFTNVGATTITGTYPNFTVNSPAASTLTATNLQINPPHTTTTLSPGDYSINIVPTTITGTGVSGTYPNYTVNASTPTIQINSPNTAATVAANNYSITVPNTSLSAAGIASVSGSHPAYTVTIPGPSLTVTGNTLTISQGTVVTTKTIAASPWNYGSGVIFPANNVINDKVAIGQNSANSNLDIFNQSGSANTAAPVVSITNSNSGLSTNGVLAVKNNTGSVAGLVVDQNSSVGDGLQVNANNVSNGSNALQVQQFGIGNAGYFSVNNSSSNGRVLDLNTNGLGMGVSIAVTNSLNANNAFYVNTNGSGPAAFLNKTGNGYGLTVQHSGSGNAGSFVNSNPINNTQAVYAQTSGSGDAIGTYNTGSGRALYATATGSMETALITNSGSGRGLTVTNSGINETSYFSNVGNGSAIVASSSGILETVNINGNGNARGMIVNSNSGTFETALFNNSSNGRGLVVQNPSASPNKAAQIIGGMDVIGKTSGTSTFALVVSNSSATNLFNVRDDGNVGIGVISSGYKLAVLDGSSSLATLFVNHTSAASSSLAHGITASTTNSHSLAAGVYADNTGTGPAIYGNKTTSGGIAGRFEIGVSGNTADAIFAMTNGGGAAIHAINGPTVAGGSNVALWMESGHLRSTQATAPTTNTVSVSGGGIQAVSMTLAGGSTDVKGVMQAVITTTGIINSGNAATVRVNFSKTYTTPPVVVVTSLTDLGLMHLFVNNITTTGFNVTMKNSTSGNMSSGTSFTLNMNYMVIE